MRAELAEGVGVSLMSRHMLPSGTMACVGKVTRVFANFGALLLSTLRRVAGF